MAPPAPAHNAVDSPSVDTASLPSVFQAAWRANPDPAALPFPRHAPPFALTPVDWAQLGLTDAEFTPHSWDNLHALISAGRLEDLKRWPSALKAYLAWTAHIKDKYGSATAYLLQQRLHWERVDGGDGALTFNVSNATPFADPIDFTILRNDWGYAFEPGIRHIVVWLKQRLPVDQEGALSDEGQRLVRDFVRREFRDKAGEKEEGNNIIWFKNTTNLQSVRGLEHVHVLIRDVDEETAKLWLK